MGWNAEQPGPSLLLGYIADSAFLGLYAPGPILKQDIMLVHLFTNISAVPPPKISQAQSLSSFDWAYSGCIRLPSSALVRHFTPMEEENLGFAIVRNH